MDEIETPTAAPELQAEPNALAGAYTSGSPDGSLLVAAPGPSSEVVEPAPAVEATDAAAAAVPPAPGTAERITAFVASMAALPGMAVAEPSPAAEAAIARVLHPDFDGVIEVGQHKLQFGFEAQALIEERFGRYEAMAERLMSFKDDPAAALLTMVQAAETCLRGALLRHHPAVTEDEIEDLYGLLGDDFVTVMMLCAAAIHWWREHDGIGTYIAGIDPSVQLGGKTYTLKWGLRAVRHYAQRLQGVDLNAIPLTHYREVLRAMLLRFHGAEVEAQAHLLDDLGLAVGLGGLRRIMAGAEQPKRPQPAGPEATPGPAEGGTGPVS